MRVRFLNGAALPAMAMACVLATPAFAATTAATDATTAKPAEGTAATAPQDDPASTGNAIVVTGRAGNGQLRKVEASYAISTINSAELQMKSPIGVAEALKNVPGFWIESSAGEASANIRVRGIPNDGYSSIALQEDGLTIQHDAGLGWLNADQAFRLDSTVQQIEVVRGGPSSIFASNAPGATVNFITRKGGDQFDGFVKYETASYDSNRIDGYVGGPIGTTPWHWLVGGFYRIGKNPRDADYIQNKGGQIRGTINGDFDWGSLMFGVKRIDDRIGDDMVTPFVNDSKGNPVGVPGFNALIDTIAGPDTREITFREPNGGSYQFNDGTGTTTKLTQITGEAKVNIAEGLTFQDNMRYHSSWQRRNEFVPYAAYNAATLLSSLSPYAAAYGGTSLGYVYNDNPTQVVNMTGRNGNGLALLDLARSFTVPTKEFVNDARLQKTTEIFGQQHNFAIGGYFAHVKESFQATSALAITDAKDNAQLLDVYALNAAGQPIAAVTEDGIYSYGSEYDNGHGAESTAALYASDEWHVTDKLRIDGGVRYEHVHIAGATEGTKSENLGESATISDNAVLVGNGVFTPFKRNFSHTGWTVGANYQFEPSVGLFARYTSAFRLPSIGDFITNANNNPVVQKMNFLESGLKVAKRHFDFYATAFRSIYNSYAISDYTLNSAGKYTGQTVYGNTKTWGVELEGTWRPVDWFDLHATYTWQNPRFSRFIYTNSSGVLTNYSNNMLIRVPKNSFRISPAVNLLNQRLRIEADVSYYGMRYSDVANQIKLPSYTTLDLEAQFEMTKRLMLNLYVDNVTNTIGLTEGNPRAGTIVNAEAGAATYLARSIYGRTFRGAISFKF